MPKNYLNKEIYRFTVYTQDAINPDADQRYGNTTTYYYTNAGGAGINPTVNRRKFVFKVPNNGINHSGKVKLAVEAVWCADMSIVLNDTYNNPLNHNVATINNFGATTNGFAANNTYNTAQAIFKTKSSSTELYSIRCPNIISSKVVDTRPSSYYSAPIIYNGKLRFANVNPEKLFCYDCSTNILNEEFVLYIDNNYWSVVGGNPVNELGIKDNLQIAITFIIYDVEEYEKGLKNTQPMDFKSDFKVRTPLLF